MPFFRRPVHALIAAATIVSVDSVHTAIHACSFTSSTVIETGPLGRRPFEDGVVMPVPSNFVALHALAELSADPRTVEEWNPPGEHPWHTPRFDFSEGRQFSFSTGIVESTGVADLTPPTMPTILSARYLEGESRDGCSNDLRCRNPSDMFEVRITASTDDFATFDRLTYAVYVGATPGEAQLAETPAALILPFEPTRLLDAIPWTPGSAARYVAIEAVDQAGNTSARSPSALF